MRTPPSALGIGHGHLDQAEQSLVAPLGHELRVDCYPPTLGGALGQLCDHRAADPSAVAILGRVVLSAFFAGVRGRGGAPARPRPRPIRLGDDRALGAGPSDPRDARRQPSRAREGARGGHGARERAGRPGGGRPAAGARPPRGTALWLVDDANPDGHGRELPPQRERRGPEPQLPLPLAAPGRRVRVRPRPRLRGRDPGDAALHRARAAARDALVPPGAPAWW